MAALGPMETPILLAVAVAMAGVTGFLIRFAAAAVGPRDRALALFLLAMMAEMFVGAGIYAGAPRAATLVEALSVSGSAMALTAAAVFLAWTGGDAVGPGPVPPARTLGPYLAGAIGCVLVGEGAMAWTFGILAPIGGLGPVVWSPEGLARLLLSPWFVFTMGAEMAFASVLLWSQLPRLLRGLLPLQTVIMVLSPPTLGLGGWVTLSVVGGSAAMTAAIVVVMEHLHRHPGISGASAAYVLGLLAAYGSMMVGLYLWLQYGTAIGLGAAVVAEMSVYLAAVLSLPRFSAASTFEWLRRPGWTTSVMTVVFVSELFMGAALDLTLAPATYQAAFAFAPLVGNPYTLLATAVSNGFWFVASATASTWFLAMMGLEMGALVVFKMRETRHLENRIRLALMIACYGAFALFYPSLYFGLYFPNAPDPSTVPVLGWSMGIGSYPLAIGVFSTVLLTYLVTGILVVMFGRRVVCSVFCTAPMMYQGTTIDSMKRFNRTEWPAQKYLGSRISRTYAVTTGVVMGSLVATSVLSYLDTTGAANFYIQGTDPTVFFFTLYFAVLWYVLFVTIPYAGNYNCVTMGWCYTGTIAQAFQKVGFFRLKVRSKEVCRRCTTLDCAQGCPVGLVDMPGYFRTQGEFRSSKCCGVGECVEACPYDNLYIADVRHWLRRRLGRPEVAAPRGVRLPMAGVARSPVGSPPASAAPES